MDIFEFLDKHGIKYDDKALIEQAFIHSSYVNEHKSGLGNNERLEFMGDAVLQVYSAERLFKIEPPLPEGLMSTRRSNLVSEKALAQIVRENELNQFLKLGVGEEKTGGRDRDSLISDMFEAFIGAVYLDQGQKAAYKLLDQLMIEHIKEIDEKTYRELLKRKDPSRRTVEKTRYCLDRDGFLYEIDVFPFWNDRAFLEVELKDEQQSFPWPENIVCIREVTDDRRYSNYALALSIPQEEI